MAKKARNKAKVTAEQVKQVALHQRLINQELFNQFTLFLIAEIMVQQQVDEILGAMHDRLLALGFDAKIVEIQLDQFADVVAGIKLARQAKKEKEAKDAKSGKA